MMENKGYSPGTEEYIKALNKLQKQFERALLYGINNKLTQSDIISLGFDLDQETKDGAYFYYGTMIDSIEVKLHCHNDSLRFEDDYTKIIITDLKARDNRTLFNGIVKNKSELKRLMKQLGI